MHLKEPEQQTEAIAPPEGGSPEGEEGAQTNSPAPAAAPQPPTKGAKAKECAKKLAKRWFIDAFTGMAAGLFCTLIAGTILNQLGKLIGDNAFGLFLQGVGGVAQKLMGAGIGAGIAYYLKGNKLTLFTCMVAGYLGANGALIGTVAGEQMFFPPLTFAIGNPIGAYLAALITLEVLLRVEGKTKVDIVVVPLLGIAVATAVVLTLCYPVNWLIARLSDGIAAATAWSPFLMGVIIAVVMGLLLTMPTSSAAIWVAIAATNTSDAMLLAGGAAVVGCAAQMIGFAVASFRENRWSGLLSQGLGTSMLQIPNIMKNPRILLPPTVASAVVGPLATCAFGLRCNAAGGGMGTAGLVGLFGVIDASEGAIPMWALVVGILLCFFVLPALISWGTSELLRKIGWIKPGDMKLDV